MKRFRMFRNMPRAFAFCEWLHNNGCTSYEIKILGAAVEVDYMTTYDLEKKIPAVFCKM